MPYLSGFDNFNFLYLDQMFNFDNAFFDKLLINANESARKRAHHTLHKDHSERVQRLCIGLKSGTYVRPHCHVNEEAWEIILVLKGKVVVLIFDDAGNVTKRIEMSADADSVGAELEPGTWHTVFPLESEAVIFEVKEGPFTSDKIINFAEWAPEENSDEVSAFLLWEKSACIGDTFRH